MYSKTRKRLSNPKYFLATTGLTLFLNSLYLLTILLNSGPVNADADTQNDAAVISSIHELGQGTLVFKQQGQYRKAAQLGTDVVMSVTGMINRVKVKQKFTNSSSQWQEGIYVFPLPENAAVDHMRLHIGDRIIEGQIKEKQEAKKTYQKAKMAGKQAALIEQERPNIFTNSVANIAPNETVIVEIEYQQIVNYDNGVFSLRFPMVVGPRYIPGKQQIEGFTGTGWALNTDEVPDAARITPPVLEPGSKYKNKVTIKIDLDAGLALEKINSAYHQIEINKQKQRYLIHLKKESVLANRDFELNWQPHPSVAPKAALFTEEKQGHVYAMLMMVPPSVEQSKTLSREMIYVIDTSGSMSGQSIIQARAALELGLNRLKPGDRFNVIQFNSITSSLFRQSQLVTTQTRQQAIDYVRALNAGGGTEMATALHKSLSNQIHQNDLRQVIFITDGSIGNEAALFNIIQRQLGQSRLFTIGIGSAPNSYFMQRAASFGRGTYTYIGKLEEVQTRMQGLFEKIERPILKDIAIDWRTNSTIESWPDKINDLYQGEPLIVTVKVDQLPDEININGDLAEKQWSTNLKLNGGQNRSGIATLWARQKITALMQKKRDAEFESIKQIIIDTALEHHLLSQFTSLVAVDVTPVRPESESLDSNAIPTHLPAGWDHSKVFGHAFPATATNARFNFLMGILLLLIAASIYLTRRHDACV